MATLARADISAAMSLILQDPMVDQFRRDIVLLHLLTVKNNGRNDTLTWNPKFTGRTAGGPYAEGADMSDGDFDSHVRQKATLNWAEYRAGAKVSGLAMSVSGAGGYAGVGSDLFDEELRDAIDKMAIDVGSDMYAGDPTASPVELAGAAIAIDSSGTFAGLNSGTYTEWVSGENTLATASLSFDELRSKLIRPVKDATGRDPDFVMCPGTVFDSIKALASDAGMNAIVNEVRVNGVTIDITRAAGAYAVQVDGVPFIEDRHCTSSTLYAITASDVEVVQLPSITPARDPARVAAAIKALTGVDTQPTEVEMRMRRSGVVVPTIEFLAQTGDAYKAMCKVYLQLKWRTRRGHAKLTLT